MSGDRKGLTLTLTELNCRHSGCNLRASVFGFCEKHGEDFIKREFIRICSEGFADLFEPICFDSLKQWQEYVVAHDIAQRQASAADRRKTVDPCRDCTPEYRDAMHSAGRCRHPETVFIMADRSREVVGVRLEKREHWEKALMGMSGHIVSMPSADVVNRVVAQFAALDSIEKKRGRPRKNESSDDE